MVSDSDTFMMTPICTGLILRESKTCPHLLWHSGMTWSAWNLTEKVTFFFNPISMAYANLKKIDSLSLLGLTWSRDYIESITKFAGSVVLGNFSCQNQAYAFISLPFIDCWLLLHLVVLLYISRVSKYQQMLSLLPSWL